MKQLIKSLIKDNDMYDKLDKYDIELIATNITNEIERSYTCEHR